MDCYPSCRWTWNGFVGRDPAVVSQYPSSVISHGLSGYKLGSYFGDSTVDNEPVYENENQRQADEYCNSTIPFERYAGCGDRPTLCLIHSFLLARTVHCYRNNFPTFRS